MRSSRKLARGSTAAGVSTWVALAFHLLAGGSAPAMAGVVIPFVLSWCACVALAAWRTDALRLTVSVVVSQVFFHTLFVLGSAGGVSGGGHVHPGAAARPELAAGHLAHSVSGPQMWLAHLAGAAVTILALRSGEQALARLGRAAVGLVRRLLLPPLGVTLPTAPAGGLPPSRITTVRPSLGRFHQDITQRGPPVGPRPC